MTQALLRAFVLVLFAAGGTDALAQRAVNDGWETDIAAFEEADRVRPPVAGGVLFVGSSSIRFWDTLETDFPGMAVVRRGFGGSEVRDATRYAARIVVPHRPRLVVMYAGDNDLAEGRTPKQVCDDVTAFVARIREDLPQVAFAWITIKPSPARANLLDAAREANALVAAWTKTVRDAQVIDIFTPMLDGEGRPREDLYGPDRLHMNRAGYAVWIERIAPVLKSASKP
ncbi:MAG TPA: SGNH/GDSL hydrolase family protein [Dokdonella sp.]|uniref:SGNH/GDSL hydrolase family protein n=1 Tax=Dokdonella sp. TaxID=2291710 RepID=UPI0025C54EBC|nr:SGNH/GDSL hydrolase family protein [Dokdonella sp.]MBX3691784.1 hypothetical protein [Dokdonella sp.]MCW5566691.1 hypothetical protein [Dokdonella sp.]HNR90785.1 SGNH/GDSL hydrolase family protein [Dokdonella sp.]